MRTIVRRLSIAFIAVMVLAVACTTSAAPGKLAITPVPTSTPRPNVIQLKCHERIPTTLPANTVYELPPLEGCTMPASGLGVAHPYDPVDAANTKALRDHAASSVPITATSEPQSSTAFHTMSMPSVVTSQAHTTGRSIKANAVQKNGVNGYMTASIPTITLPSATMINQFYTGWAYPAGAGCIATRVMRERGPGAGVNHPTDYVIADAYDCGGSSVTYNLNDAVIRANYVANVGHGDTIAFRIINDNASLPDCYNGYLFNFAYGVWENSVGRCGHWNAATTPGFVGFASLTDPGCATISPTGGWLYEVFIWRSGAWNYPRPIDTTLSDDGVCETPYPFWSYQESFQGTGLYQHWLAPS
jgi:hypothetical protein